MSAGGKRNPGDRWNAIRIEARRRRCREQRSGAVHHRDHVRLNPNFKRVRRSFEGKVVIELPVRLHCDDPQNLSEVCAIARLIRKNCLDKGFQKITINFGHVESLSSDAALILLSEIQRCRRFLNRKQQLTGTYPLNANVSKLLYDLGFYKALDIRKPKTLKDPPDKFFVQIASHNQTQAEVSYRLLETFRKIDALSQAEQRMLQVAIVECMDNAKEHAYPKGSNQPYLLREWWLCGYADPETQTAQFSFFDQGVGIPETVRRKQKMSMGEFFTNWSDASWINVAVKKKVSRHASDRRGHGLEKLMHILDRHGTSGVLRVAGGAGMVEFTPGKSNPLTVANPLDGTLISWQLTARDIQEI